MQPLYKPASCQEFNRWSSSTPFRTNINWATLERRSKLVTFGKGATLYVVSPQTRTAFRDTVSYALAEAVTESAGNARMFVSAIYRLLECNSSDEIADFLVHRGIPWQMNLPFEAWQMESGADWSEDQQPDGESIAEQIRDSLTANLVRRASTAPANPSTCVWQNPCTLPTRSRCAGNYHRIEEVVVQEVDPCRHAYINYGGKWRLVAEVAVEVEPGRRAIQERDRLLGERGEELVYLRELERSFVKQGYESPESLVTWVSRDDPTADHDIRSVGENGATLWIEVKSTSGSDGNFDWPESEVARAMAEREHYVLCRVYRAGSRNPIIKRFHDPLSMIESCQMRLGLGSVRAQVESAETS